MADGTDDPAAALADAILDQETGLAEGHYLKLGNSLVPAPPAAALRDIEERVAALEARMAPGPLLKPFGLPPLTEEQEAHLKRDFNETMRVLTRDEIRQLLRECVTVVKPGETLVIRGRDWTPNQCREIQEVMNTLHEDGLVPFRALAIFGDELAVAEPEPEFMSETREAATVRNRAKAVSLTHLPTRVTVEAPTRPEAVAKLGRALERHAQRHPEKTPGAT